MMFQPIRLFLLAFLLPCLALTAIASLPQPAWAAPETPAQAAPAAEAPTAIAALEGKNRTLRYERDIAQIRVDLRDAQTSWLENLIAMFGILITVLLVAMAFGFGKSAVTAAKLGITEEREKIQTMLKDAQALLDQIKGHEQTALGITKSLAAGETPKDPKKRQTLRDIAKDAEQKPRAERTLDEYRALVLVANMDEDWEVMERRAAAMAYLFEDADPESLCFALFSRAYALGKLGRPEEGLAAYAEIERRYGESAEPALQEVVAMALVNKGVALVALGRPKEALAACAEIERRYGESAEPVLQEQVAGALVNKGVALGKLGRYEEALAVCEDVERRYGESAEPVLQELVAKALSNKGVTLGALDRPEEVLAVCEGVERRYGESAEPALQKQVAKALVNKGVTLGALGRPEEELAAYAEVERRYGESAEPALQEAVADALFNKACTYALKGRVEDCIAALAQWRDRAGGLDCDKIAGDSDFDPIRADPRFQAFLQDNGCTGGA